jgi:hypothetical protein
MLYDSIWASQGKSTRTTTSITAIQRFIIFISIYAVRLCPKKEDEVIKK